MKFLLQIYIFIVGTIFGSFYNVCIYRIPKNKSISNPPSTCITCNTRLKPIDLIPILSYLMSGKKCRYCKREISSRYAVVEFLTGILFILVYNVHSISLETIYYLILLSILVIITFIDIDYYIIPDGIIIFGLVISLILNITGIGVSIKESFIGFIICGGGVLVLTNIIKIIVKKEVMGGGDIKLFAMIGFFLGIKGGLITIIISVYVGTIYSLGTILYSKLNNKEYKSMIPYGPFISIGAVIALLYGNNILNWYFNLFV